MTKHLRVATYNIHKCRGMDRRVSPERIARLLRGLDADVIALQEVVHHHRERPETDQAQFLAAQLGYECVFGEARTFLTHGRYGNAVLTRLPIVGSAKFDITAKREPRSCLHVDMKFGGKLLHVFNVHLGTGFYERRAQAHHLVSKSILNNPRLKGARIMLGDFNEWTRGLATEFVSAHLQGVDVRQHVKRGKTYPGILPVMHLDHIYFDQPLTLERFRVVRSARALIASDHLPLVADFSWPE